MATPLSTNIVNNVVSTLSGITAGSTYSRTVNVCQRLTFTAPELSEFDAVFVYDAGCTKEYLVSNVTRCEQIINLECWIQDDDTAEAIDQLAADIEKALSVDATRGSNAIDTKIQAVRKYISEDLQPEAYCEIDVLITYRHFDGDPYTAV